MILAYSLCVIGVDLVVWFSRNYTNTDFLLAWEEIAKPVDLGNGDCLLLATHQVIHNPDFFCAICNDGDI